MKLNVVKYRKYSLAKFESFQTIFEPKMVTISARNTNILKICKLRKAIFSVFYNISWPNFAILLVIMFFSAVVFDSLLFT
jgi:hypothetical protein